MTEMRDNLWRIYERTGNVPLAILKEAVVWEDDFYIYVDTQVKPGEWVTQAEEAVKFLEGKA